MPGNPPRLYWDANCFLYYLNDDPTWGPRLEYHLRRATAEKAIEIVTSVLSITEVAFTTTERLGRRLNPEEEARIEELWQADGIALVEVTSFVARLARDLHRQRLQLGWTNPGAPDLIHLATAQYMQVSEVHTIEDKLHRYSQLIGLPVGFPPEELPKPPPPLTLPGFESE